MPLISVLTPTIRGEEGLKRPKESLDKQDFKDFEWLCEIHRPNEPPDFNHAMNRLLRKAKGKLVVSLQDFIKIPTDGLRKFWEAYEKNKTTFFTAPVGQTEDDKKIEWDWRAYRSENENLNFMEWEIDWASAPLDKIIEVGGFDEELDKYWGFDNVNIGLRIINAGYEIKNLPTNKAVAFKHNLFINHPYQKLRNPDFHNQRLRQIEMGLKINFYE